MIRFERDLRGIVSAVQCYDLPLFGANRQLLSRSKSEYRPLHGCVSCLEVNVGRSHAERVANSKTDWACHTNITI